MSLEDLQKQMNTERQPRKLAADDPFAAYAQPPAAPAGQAPAPIAGQPLPITGQPLPISGQPLPQEGPVAPPPPPRATYSAFPPAGPPAQPSYAPPAPPAYAPPAYAPPAYAPRTSQRPAATKSGTQKAPRQVSYAAPSKAKPLLIVSGILLVVVLIFAFSFTSAGQWGEVTGINDFAVIPMPVLAVTDEGDGLVGIKNNSMLPIVVQYIIINGAAPAFQVNEAIQPRLQHKYTTPARGEMRFVRVQTDSGTWAGHPDPPSDNMRDNRGNQHDPGEMWRDVPAEKPKSKGPSKSEE